MTTSVSSTKAAPNLDEPKSVRALRIAVGLHTTPSTSDLGVGRLLHRRLTGLRIHSFARRLVHRDNSANHCLLALDQARPSSLARRPCLQCLGYLGQRDRPNTVRVCRRKSSGLDRLLSHEPGSRPTRHQLLSVEPSRRQALLPGSNPVSLSLSLRPRLGSSDPHRVLGAAFHFDR